MYRFQFALVGILGLFLFIYCEKQAPSQVSATPSKQAEIDKNYQPYIYQLDSLIYPLEGASPLLSQDDLKPFDVIGSCKIVGLGEATHGTKEFFQLKHRIFQYLVENHGYRIFAFESDMGESWYVNQYILHGIGDLDDIMRNKMLFWTWRTKEVKELLQWMRKYNVENDEKIYFVGIDCQILLFQTEIILSYITQYLPDYLDQVQSRLDKLIEHSRNTTKQKQAWCEGMTSDDKKDLNDDVDSVIALMDSKKAELVHVSSYFEFKYMRRLLVNLKQILDVKCTTANTMGTNYRDMYMAENVIWLIKALGIESKIAVWAHNAHIENNPLLGSTGSMGSYIKTELGEQCKLVGFSFAQGSFIAYTQSQSGQNLSRETQTLPALPVTGSINYLFHFSKEDNFILNLDEISPGSILFEWLTPARQFIIVGTHFNEYYYKNAKSNYQYTQLLDYYDIVIHYDKTRASEPL